MRHGFSVHKVLASYLIRGGGGGVHDHLYLADA